MPIILEKHDLRQLLVLADGFLDKNITQQTKVQCYKGLQQLWSMLGQKYNFNPLDVIIIHRKTGEIFLKTLEASSCQH